jgi:hypothetical protein
MGCPCGGPEIKKSIENLAPGAPERPRCGGTLIRKSVIKEYAGPTMKLSGKSMTHENNVP